ncbi:hypothetical protein BX600DRAFT_544160 [Xylariales sp. PMI_506]|nr:hypothetical protein BX600DRAFT_544160 [Xylariales sp. PMI_506]
MQYSLGHHREDRLTPWILPFPDMCSPLLGINRESRMVAKTFYDVKLTVYKLPRVNTQRIERPRPTHAFSFLNHEWECRMRYDCAQQLAHILEDPQARALECGGVYLSLYHDLFVRGLYQNERCKYSVFIDKQISNVIHPECNGRRRQSRPAYEHRFIAFKLVPHHCTRIQRVLAVDYWARMTPVLGETEANILWWYELFRGCREFLRLPMTEARRVQFMRDRRANLNDILARHGVKRWTWHIGVSPWEAGHGSNVLVECP